MSRRLPLTRAFAALTGFYVWSLQFTIIYGATSVMCAREWAGVRVLGFGIVYVIIVVTTVLSLAVTAATLIWAVRAWRRLEGREAHDPNGFLIYLTVVVSAFSLVAIAYNGLPGLILPACA